MLHQDLGVYLPESGSKFWEFIFSPSPTLKTVLQRWNKNELPKRIARLWNINSLNSGTRGCGTGPSSVTLNLSVYKAYKKKQKKNSIHVFYNTSACDSY